MRYSASQYLLNAVADINVLCACCSQPTIARTVWAQVGTGRKGVAANAITIIRAQNKVIELYASDKMVGEMPCLNGKAPTLASTAAAMGGKWVLARRDTMVRVESISYWRPDGDHGAHLLVDGVPIHSTRTCWPNVRRAIDCSL